jgi:hypothetical protein
MSGKIAPVDQLEADYDCERPLPRRYFRVERPGKQF